MANCFFISDLHGNYNRYNKLFEAIKTEHPAAVFIGGDILPSGLLNLQNVNNNDFIKDFLLKELYKLKEDMEKDYPRLFVILGNDDGRFEEPRVLDAELMGIWEYVHGKNVKFRDFNIYGYSYVPPTPFGLKDWERYDISSYVDPGCISPEEGWHSIPVSKDELKYSTIKNDLEILTGKDNLEKGIFLFHSPPYKTNLDRAGLDGKMIEGVPVDVHVGSIAIKRFIEDRQPFLTLHGHIHESSRLTGCWKEKLGSTTALSAAYDGPGLALIKFALEDISTAERYIL